MTEISETLSLSLDRWHFCVFPSGLCFLSYDVIFRLPFERSYSAAQSSLTLWNPLGCSPPGSSVHEIFQARILERVAISSFRRSSWPKDWICVSCVAGEFFTAESPGKPRLSQNIICHQPRIPIKDTAQPRTSSVSSSLALAYPACVMACWA